ncbi:SRPBCC family protein [Aequorivita sublithincola]|nr:SRPBCC family protein [Aequorivita sublithincola]
MNTTKITVEKTINADSKKVWDYWNQPEHITNWNFANYDWCCPKASNDLQVGGKLFTRMEATDGSFGFNFEGIYDEIVPQKKISYKITDGRNVTTTFENLGEKTKVTTVFDAENSNPIEMQRAGWQAILDNFKRYTENN